MILGIDTSNYTTSVAIITNQKKLIFDQRIVLNVRSGERGLRQSMAIFQHQKNLPILLQQAFRGNRNKIMGISFSGRPRPLADSYMPVFTVGEGYARTIATVLNLPLFETTHQENHLAAGLWSTNFRPEGPFLVFHLSGGTTDLLKVTPLEAGYQILLLGSSNDLHVGQFIDRIGVKLGMKFPAGPALEQLANQKRGDYLITLPSAVTDYMISFSGPCTAAERELDAGVEAEEIAFSVFRCIANSVEKVLIKALAETGIKNILFVGGVAANKLIKERLTHRLSHPAIGASLYFTKPDYSRDNAIGTAILGGIRLDLST